MVLVGEKSPTFYFHFIYIIMKYKTKFFGAAIVCAAASIIMLANTDKNIQTLAIVPIVVGFLMAILGSVETVEPTDWENFVGAIHWQIVSQSTIWLHWVTSSAI